MDYLPSNEATIALGEMVGKNLRPGDILLLEGDLGAGKTTFAQGVAKGLGVNEFVNSPTFVIINEYFSGRLPLYHMDLYRVEDESQLYDLGIEEYLFGNGVCLVEWPAIALPLMPEEVAWIRLEQSGDGRVVTLETHGDYSNLKEAFNEYFSV